MNHLRSDSKIPTYQGVICGGLAGLGTRMIVAPLDMIKIRLQLQSKRLTLPYVARIVKETLVTEGPRAFWKGNLPASLLYVTYSGCQFGSLKVTNALLNQYKQTRDWPEPLKQFVSGGFSGVVSTALTYPFDLLRTRGAANKQSRNAMIRTIRQIYNHQGFRGFFQGSSTAIAGIIPYMGTFFSMYSILRDSRVMEDMPSWFPSILSASFIAGAFSKTLVMPLDTVRKRVQVFATADPLYPRSFFKVAHNIIKNEGFLALYRGWSIAITKTLPSSFFSIYLFELSLSTWQRLASTANLASSS